MKPVHCRVDCCISVFPPRLPRDVLAAEVQRIENLGVKIHLNHPINNVESEKTAGNFDAVLLAIGAQLANRVDIPGCDAEKIINALGLLRGVASKEDVKFLMAGADVAMTTSALLRHGPGFLRVMLYGLREWMLNNGYHSIDELRGSMSLKNVENPQAYERAQYIKQLSDYELP